VNKFLVYTPNKSKSSSVIEIAGQGNFPSSKGGALSFLHVSDSGSRFTTQIFSPIGYTQCVTNNKGNYDVYPTFDAQNPTITPIQASYTEISDEDGAAMFINADTDGNKILSAFFTRSVYLWILYDGSA
jgi:hypothetical protein